TPPTTSIYPLSLHDALPIFFVEAICYPECGGGDGLMFKGPFVRNLAYLYEANPLPRYREFLIRQSDAIWEHNRTENNQFGQFWRSEEHTSELQSRENLVCRL